MPVPSFLETTHVVLAEKHISSAETVAALQKRRVKQAGVVLLGCGGGTWLGSQPCSSRQENARNAGEVEEKEEGCCQLHGHGLSLRDPLTCGTGLLNSVKMTEVATRQSSGGLGLLKRTPLNIPISLLHQGLKSC